MRQSITDIIVVDFYGCWLFLDKLDESPDGIWEAPPELMEGLAERIPEYQTNKGFTLYLSAERFPGYQTEWVFLAELPEGQKYREVNSKREGVICPEFFKYFGVVPDKIFVKVEYNLI